MQTYTIEHAVRLIKALPASHGGRGRAWSSDVGSVTYVAATILSATDRRKTLDAIADQADASHSTLHLFAQGKNSGGSEWPELRACLKAGGVKWLMDRREQKRLAHIEAAAVAEGQKAAKQAAVPIAAQQVAAPEKSAATPANDLPRNWRIDRDMQDIIVTTTARLMYGTQEHRKKMADIALQLGTSAQSIVR